MTEFVTAVQHGGQVCVKGARFPACLRANLNLLNRAKTKRI